MGGSGQGEERRADELPCVLYLRSAVERSRHTQAHASTYGKKTSTVRLRDVKVPGRSLEETG